MAYDESIAERVRKVLRSKRGVTERRMFGGIAFMLHGHMCVGILDDSLMARVGPENYEKALAKSGVRRMDFTGKPMRGYVFVGPEALRTDAQLGRWIEICAEFVRTLPSKTAK